MWAKVDDQILDNPKIAGLSPEAKLTYFAAIVHCKQQMTDGLIAVQLLPIVVCKAHATYVASADTIAAELVAAGLWEPVDSGWMLHDWLEWNDSAQDIRDRAAAAKERKRKWAERQRDTDATPTERVAERVPNASIDVTATPSRRDRDADATPISDNPYPISEREERENLTSFGSLAADDLENRGPPPRRGGDPTHIADLLPALPATAQPGAPPPPVPAVRTAPKPAKARKQRPPDPVWDASVQCEPVTNDAERKARNEACRLLRQSLDGAGIADDYPTRHAAVLHLWQAYPDAMPPGNRRTFNAVARNVGKILNHATGRNTPTSPQAETAGYGVIG